MNTIKTFSELKPNDAFYMGDGSRIRTYTFVSLKTDGNRFKISYKDNFNRERYIKISNVYLDKSVSLSCSTYNDKSVLEKMDFNYKIFVMHYDNIKLRKLYEEF
jgi:hypothetical protein